MSTLSKLVTLDWDNISWIELNRRIEILKKDSNIKSIDVRMSATSGFHVYILLKKKREALKLRRKWKDDGRRLILDVLFRQNKNYSDVMFTKKIKNSIVWNEIKLYTINL